MSLKNFVYESVADILNGKYEAVNERVEKHKDIYHDDTAICFSLLSLSSFLHKDYNNFYQFMNDASFLVDQTKEPLTKIFHELIMGFVNFTEKNTTLYSINYNKARKLSIKNQQTDFFEKINSMLKCPPITHFTPNHGGQTKDPLIALVKIGQAVAAEKDINLLIRTIAEETKTALNADRCTVYLYDKENDELYSKVATGLDVQELRIPADKGLAGHVLRTGETINIKDAYSDKRFNSSVDKETGYRTKNMLCMPIKNFNQEIIGVFQVLNKFDEYFTPEDEDLLVAIASNAGISLENAQLFERQRKLLEEQKVVLDSFIETLATSIDARDKITSGHSTRVKMYAVLIAKEFGMEQNDLYILEKIHMSKDFQQIMEIACSHHEKFDGSGYYRHLKGTDIPFGGRILAVSDVFDAITSKRHYRDKMPIDKVINIIKDGAGSHFDPLVVEKFLAIKLSEIVKVFCTENSLKIDDEDMETLQKYNLLDLYYSIVNNCSNKLLQVFNKYYVGIDLENE